MRVAGLLIPQRGTKRGRKSLIPLGRAGKIAARCGAEGLDGSARNRLTTSVLSFPAAAQQPIGNPGQPPPRYRIPAQTFGPTGMTRPLLRRDRSHRHVVQDGPKPALHLGDVHILTRGVVFDLVAFDLGDAEIMRVGVSDIDAAH
jgi:hypothetical protein